jgi:hypothetical protein
VVNQGVGGGGTPGEGNDFRGSRRFERDVLAPLE